MIKRYGQILLLTSALAAGGVAVVAANAGASSSAGNATAATKQVVTTLPVSNGSSTTAQRAAATTPATGSTTTTLATPTGGRRGGGGRGDFGGFGGPGFGRPGGLTVTSINGNAITATEHGMTVTVQVSATTVYTEADAPATLSDIHVGTQIAVRSAVTGTSMGTRTNPRTLPSTLNATGITILLPQESGVVTNVSSTSLTLTDFGGTSHTVTLTGNTRYQKAGQSAAASDITTGTAVNVQGTRNSDGSLTAMLVAIRLPQVGGSISAVNGSSYTVSGRGGMSITINTTATTTYVNADGSTATAAALKSGVFIMAEGTLSSDQKTLTALRITVMPANGGRGHGGFGGPGGFGGLGNFGDQGNSIAPSSTPALTGPGTTGSTSSSGTTTNSTPSIDE